MIIVINLVIIHLDIINLVMFAQTCTELRRIAQNLTESHKIVQNCTESHKISQKQKSLAAASMLAVTDLKFISVLFFFKKLSILRL